MLSFILLTAALISLGQEPVLTGRVYSAADSSAVKAFTVYLTVEGDTVPAVLNVTDGPAFTAGCPGAISGIAITAVGFREYTVEAPQIAASHDLGNLYLEPRDAVELKDVEVTAPEMMRNQDRTMFFVNSAEAMASVSVPDLISRLRIPGAMVDLLSGSVTVDGAPVAYEVDNVPRDLAYVRTVNPSRVARIEVSDHPTARYIGTGVGRVIYIFLKEPASGGSVYDNLRSFVTRENLANDASLSYNQGRSEITLTHNLTLQNDYRYFYEGLQSYRGASTSVDITELADRRTTRANSNRINLDWTYRMDRKTLLMVEGSARIYRDTYFMSTENTRSEHNPQGSATLRYTAEEDTRNDMTTPSVEVYFSHEGDTYALDADVKGSIGHAVNDWSNSESAGGESVGRFVNHGTNRTSSLAAEFNYRRVRPHGFLTLTARNVYTAGRSEYETPSLSVADQRSNDTWLSLSRLWSSGRSYLMAVIGGTLRDFSNGSLHHTSAAPTAMLRGQHVVRKFQLAATVNYNHAYPSLSETDTTVLRSNEYLYRRGNPDLGSSSTISGNLDCTYFDPHWTGRVSVSYTADIDRIINDYLVVDDRYMIMPVNAEMCGRLGFYGNLSYTLRTGHLRLTAGGSVNAARYHTRMPGAEGLSVFGVRYTPHISVYHDAGASLTVSYTSSQKSLDGITETIWGRNLQVQMTFRCRSFNFFLLADCLGVNTGTTLVQTVLSPVYHSRTYAEGRQQANGICLGVSYRADFGRIFGKTEKRITQPDTDPTNMILDSGR